MRNTPTGSYATAREIIEEYKIQKKGIDELENSICHMRNNNNFEDAIQNITLDERLPVKILWKEYTDRMAKMQLFLTTEFRRVD